MLKITGLFVLSVTFLLGVGWYVITREPSRASETPTVMTSTSTPTISDMQAERIATTSLSIPEGGVTQPEEMSIKPAEVKQERAGLSQADLLGLASDPFTSGNVPLGDYKYTTTRPKQGLVYLCNARKDGGGAETPGPWIHGVSWNFLEKARVGGSVAWPSAKFANKVDGEWRLLSGNALPLSHTTGTFPVGANDPAYLYDRNPNSITAQNIGVSLPVRPTYSETPYCMGGEVGIMLTGVPLFNAFDAGLRDAPAHELQDSCDGHPQVSGEYHYHSLSSCMKDTSVTTILGYAYDGFPITGPVVAKGKYLTTENLDVCHGITSEIMQDGKPVMSYHYVMTQDFPYSVSCFRGKPATTGPSVSPGGGGTSPQGASGGANMPQQGGAPGSPPAEALAACSGKSDGGACSFAPPQGGMISGICRTPPSASALACVPN